MGYVTDTDGKFKGDVLVIDAQGLSEAYRANECHVIRTKIGEIIQVKWPDISSNNHVGGSREFKESNWIFPVAQGLLKQPDDDIMDSRFVPMEKPYQKSKPKMGEGVEEETEIDPESKTTAVTDSPHSRDKWELRGDFLVRVHTEPIMALYLSDETCPLKHSWLDIYLEARTSLPHDTHKRHLESGLGPTRIMRRMYWRSNVRNPQAVCSRWVRVSERERMQTSKN